MRTGCLRLALTDVRGNALRNYVSVELTGLDRATVYSATAFIEEKLDLQDIACEPKTRYLLRLWPTDFRAVETVVTLEPGLTVYGQPIQLPVDPDKVEGIVAPAHEQLEPRLQQVVPADLYDSLDSPRRASLLNVAARAAATRLPDGSDCLDYLGELIHLRSDRFCVRVDAALLSQVREAGLEFRPAAQFTHHTPEGFSRAGSYRTRDRYASLSIGFYRAESGEGGLLADFDLDHGGGLEEFGVIEHAAAQGPVSPYDLREILLRQSIDPRYEFRFLRQVTTVGISG